MNIASSPAKSAFVAGLLVCLAAPPCRATEPLTLEAAIASALAGNETSGIALARLEGASALRRQAVAQLIPALTISANATRRAREVDRIIDGDRVTVQALEAYSSQAVVETPLFDLRAVPLIRAANHGLEAQTIESDELRRALAFDVADGFFAVLSAEELRAAAAKRVQVARQTVEESSLRLDAGLATRNDLTRTQLEEATARLEATRAENLVTTVRLALAYLIAAPVDGELVPPARAATPAADRDALVDRALAERRELVALDERWQQLQKLARAPRLGWVPRLDLRGIYRWTNEAGLSGREEDWNLGLNLTWEIFDGGDRSAIADQRDAQAREAELVLAGRRRQVALEIDQARADLATAAAALEQARVRSVVAEQNVEEVSERFQYGLATALEQTDAQVASFEAEAEMARQGFAHAVAGLALDEALGGWPVPLAAIQEEKP
ncbi:MAG: TolC family protein [Thermoanaerobaculia bacterium]